jgi:hypothetical protein
VENGKEGAQLIKSKRVFPLYYSRLSPSVDSAAAGILQIKRISLDGFNWDIIRCPVGGERVKFEQRADESALPADYHCQNIEKKIKLLNYLEE